MSKAELSDRGSKYCLVLLEVGRLDAWPVTSARTYRCLVQYHLITISSRLLPICPEQPMETACRVNYLSVILEWMGIFCGAVADARLFAITEIQKMIRHE